MALTADSFWREIVAGLEPHGGFDGTFKHFVVAYSGGLDSTVLLHLCHQIRERLISKGIACSAVYIDHQLQADSAHWGEICRKFCDQLQIPFQSIQVDASAGQRQSPEAAAREARYQAFQKLLTQGDCLLTAHHRSDQSETLLLQMLRGSGPMGLAAMPSYKTFYHAYLLRPLLNVSRDEIQSYAQQHQLSWIEDQSNWDQRFQRNFLRHEVIPLLQQQWPSLEKTLQRVTQLQAQAVDVLQEVAQQDLESSSYRSQTDGPLEFWQDWQVLRLDVVQSLGAARINQLIQYWLRQNHIPVLNAALLQRLQRELIFAAGANKALIQWQGKQRSYALRRHHHLLVLDWEFTFDGSRIYCLTAEQIKQTQCLQTDSGVIRIQAENPITADSDLLSHHPGLWQALAMDKLDKGIEVRYRQGGEKYALDETSHHSLKKWMQEQRIPYWLRDKIPLFYSADCLFQVGNRLLDKRFQARPSDSGVYIHWQFMH